MNQLIMTRVSTLFLACSYRPSPAPVSIASSCIAIDTIASYVRNQSQGYSSYTTSNQELELGKRVGCLPCLTCAML